MDRHGILPDALDAACRMRAPKAIYMTPTYQIPTSAMMPLDRREAVVETCRRHGVAIIEDDNYGFLDETSVSLARLAPELCVYLTSMSKSVSAGLRLGYLQVPPAMLERVLAALRATTYSTMPLAGEIAARMIRAGDAARAAAWYRDLARRRAALVAALPDGRGRDMTPGSSQLWLKLPDGTSDGAFAAAARARGIGVMPAAAFSLDGAPVPAAVRVAFCAPDDDAAVARAFRELAGLLAAPVRVAPAAR